MLSIRPIASDAERDACYRVRWVVFVDEQKVPPWEELDEHDEVAVHLLAEVDGDVVGTARLVDYGHGIGKIGRVAVLAEHRGRGVGYALMERMIEEGFARFETLALDAQLQVIPFYERLGFIAEGPEFLDANIPHRRMTRSRG